MLPVRPCQACDCARPIPAVRVPSWPEPSPHRQGFFTTNRASAPQAGLFHHGEAFRSIDHISNSRLPAGDPTAAGLQKNSARRASGRCRFSVRFGSNPRISSQGISHKIGFLCQKASVLPPHNHGFSRFMPTDSPQAGVLSSGSEPPPIFEKRARAP